MGLGLRGLTGLRGLKELRGRWDEDLGFQGLWIHGPFFSQKGGEKNLPKPLVKAPKPDRLPPTFRGLRAAPEGRETQLGATSESCRRKGFRVRGLGFRVLKIKGFRVTAWGWGFGFGV